MRPEERIAELEKEIQEFDNQRLKKQEHFQQLQNDFQIELTQINQGILTRRGGIIELKRLMVEENDSNSS